VDLVTFLPKKPNQARDQRLVVVDDGDAPPGRLDRRL